MLILWNIIPKKTTQLKIDRGIFTLPAELKGCVVRGSYIDEVVRIGIPDKNKYDVELLQLHKKLKKDSDGDYNLIFAKTRKYKTIAHEISHILYRTNSQYKKEMKALVSSLKKKRKKFFEKEITQRLLRRGYVKKWHTNEAHARLSTNFDDFYGNRGYSRRIGKPFEKVFYKYAKDIPILKKYFKK